MINSIGKTLQKHITHTLSNSNYAAKTLVYSAAALTLGGDMADSFQLRKNKKLKEDERKYLSAFSMTKGIISSTAQIGVGLAVLSDRTQTFIRNGLAKISPKIAETLKTNVAKKNLMSLTSLISAVIVTKRIIVPFITTPIASNVKKSLNNIANDDRNEENIFRKGRHKTEYDDHDDD